MPAVVVEADAEARGGRCRTPRRSATPGTPRARPRSGSAATPRETGASRRLVGVRVALAPLLERPLRRERLRARDQREVELAAEHALGRRVHELLGRRAADAGVVPVARIGAEPFGEPRDRIVVLPGLAVDDLDAVEPLQEPSGLRRVAAARDLVLPSRAARGAPSAPDFPGMPGTRGDADDARGAPSTLSPGFPHRRSLLGEGLRPSLASSVRKITPEIFDSSLKGDRSSWPSRSRISAAASGSAPSATARRNSRIARAAAS